MSRKPEIGKDFVAYVGVETTSTLKRRLIEYAAKERVSMTKIVNDAIEIYLDASEYYDENDKARDERSKAIESAPMWFI